MGRLFSVERAVTAAGSEHSANPLQPCHECSCPERLSTNLVAETTARPPAPLTFRYLAQWDDRLFLH